MNEKQKGEWSERWMNKAEYRAFVDSLVSEYGKSLPKGGAWFRGDSAWMSEGRVDTLRQKIIELNEMYERMLDKTKACPEK